MAESITIADAVVTELNAQSWDLSFTATRRNLVALKLTDLSTLTVVAAHKARRKVLYDRDENALDYDVEIGIAQHLRLTETDADNNALLDPLLSLAEAIDDHFDAATLPGYTSPDGESARWQASEWSDGPDELQQLNTFLAVIRLTFRVLQTR